MRKSVVFAVFVFGFLLASSFASASSALSFAGKPDLTSELLPKDAHGAVGSKITLQIKTTNIGKNLALRSTTRVSSGYKKYLDFQIPLLWPNASSVRSFKYTCATEGQHVLNSTADFGKRISESNEDNNGGLLTVTCGNGPGPSPSPSASPSPSPSPNAPDLTSSFSVSAINVGWNGSAKILVNTTNLGNEKAGKSTTRVYEQPGRYTFGGTAADLVFDALSPKASKVKSFNYVCNGQGPHVFDLTADFDNKISESNESNNGGSPIVVNCGSSYDLALYLLPRNESPNSPESTQIKFLVKNLGTATANSQTVVKIYREPYNQYPLANVSIKTLAPGESASGVLNVACDWYWTSPDYKFFITVDSSYLDSNGSYSLDANWSNNRHPLAISCVPDYSLSISTFPGRVRGMAAVVNITAKNKGNSVARPASLLVVGAINEVTEIGTFQYENGNVFGPYSVYPGKSGTKSYSFNCDSAWVKPVNATVDFNRAIHESDEGNNFASATVECMAASGTSKSDLVVSSLDVSNGTNEEKVEFKAILKNIGTEASGVSWFSHGNNLDAGLPWYLQRPIKIPSLAPGEQFKVNLSFYCVPRSSWSNNTWVQTSFPPFTAKVDSNNSIDELDENNNALNYSYSCNVVPPDREINLTTNSGGVESRIKVQIKNIGEGAARPSKVVLCRTGGFAGGWSGGGCYSIPMQSSQFAVSDTPLLRPGESFAFDDAYYPCEKAGTFNLTAVAYTSGQDESFDQDYHNGAPRLRNNVVMQNYQCPGPYFIDLTAVIGANETTLNLGESTTVFLTVKNIGLAETGYPYYDRQAWYYYNPAFDSMVMLPNIFPGREFTQNKTVVCGEREADISLKYVADARNALFESDESNNEATIVIHCRQNSVDKPDLAITKVQVVNGSYHTSSNPWGSWLIPIIVNVTVKNVGKSMAPASGTLLRMAKPYLDSYGSVKALRPGEKTVVGHTVYCNTKSTIPGNVTVDYANVVREADEGNNFASLKASCKKV